MQVGQLDKRVGSIAGSAVSCVMAMQGRRVALLVADDFRQHLREERLLLRRPAVEAAGERQHETRFASAEAPAIGGLAEKRGQQILAVAVQVSVHLRPCHPARIVAYQCGMRAGSRSRW